MDARPQEVRVTYTGLMRERSVDVIGEIAIKMHLSAHAFYRTSYVRRVKNSGWGKESPYYHKKGGWAAGFFRSFGIWRGGILSGMPTDIMA